VGVDDLDRLDELAGRLVRLRAMTVDDIDALMVFDRDSDGARRWGETNLPRSPEATRTATEERLAKPPVGDTGVFVIEVIADRAVAGTTSVGRANPRHGRFSYGIGLGEPYRNKGYGTEAITLLLRFYFAELRYEKCDTSVYSFNDGSLRVHERLGFQVEGRVRRAIFTAGEHHDEIMVGITAEEFFARHGRTQGTGEGRDEEG
jgi:RimJ/RimL family protein N-acetyltransferase